MPLTFADPSEPAIPLHVLSAEAVQDWLAGQTERVARWVEANGFAAGIGETCLVPDAEGGIAMALAGVGTEAQRSRGRFALASITGRLPDGTYAATTPISEEDALGWLLSGYRFDRYRAGNERSLRLAAPAGLDAARIEKLAAGEALTRDLINTPAADMGPEALEAAMADLAHRFDAGLEVIRGDALLSEHFPLIHTVGRASQQEPRLLDLTWGREGPTLTLVGKGVCFDTGGLNLKPAASMGLMKKDMGGAATVIGLAQMIMALSLPMRLRVLVPAVENAVSGNAFRPQDILSSRKGLTIEINNTDAEGRLVLADALTFAEESQPDLIISMATLTGAARVAVGPDLAPFYTDGDALAAALQRAAKAQADPVWRMPFHTPYEPMIEPGIADLDNAPKGGFAGSITAALFLRRFVSQTPYIHFDIYGWQPKAAPARPVGGVGQGARAVLAALPDMLGL